MRKTAMLVAIALALLGWPLLAQQTYSTTGNFLQPVSHATLICESTQDCTLTGQAFPFTSTGSLLNPTAGAVRVCALTVETQNVRWWEDGTSPSSTVGHVLAKDNVTPFVVAGPSLQLFKARATTTGAVIQVTCYR